MRTIHAGASLDIPLRTGPPTGAPLDRAAAGATLALTAHPRGGGVPMAGSITPTAPPHVAAGARVAGQRVNQH
jgi:hypothetical protein